RAQPSPDACLSGSARRAEASTHFGGGRRRGGRGAAEHLRVGASSDWDCVSDPENKTIKLAAAGTSGIFAPTGTQLLNLSDNSVWDPRQFTLTTEDGSVYTIDQDGGVSQIEDRDANTLSITRDGIWSSMGQSVPFVRDAK